MRVCSAGTEGVLGDGTSPFITSTLAVLYGSLEFGARHPAGEELAKTYDASPFVYYYPSHATTERPRIVRKTIFTRVLDTGDLKDLPEFLPARTDPMEDEVYRAHCVRGMKKYLTRTNNRFDFTETIRLLRHEVLHAKLIGDNDRLTTIYRIGHLLIEFSRAWHIIVKQKIQLRANPETESISRFMKKALNGLSQQQYMKALEINLGIFGLNDRAMKGSVLDFQRLREQFPKPREPLASSSSSKRRANRRKRAAEAAADAIVEAAAQALGGAESCVTMATSEPPVPTTLEEWLDAEIPSMERYFEAITFAIACHLRDLVLSVTDDMELDKLEPGVKDLLVSYLRGTHVKSDLPTLAKLKQFLEKFSYFPMIDQNLTKVLEMDPEELAKRGYDTRIEVFDGYVTMIDGGVILGYLGDVDLAAQCFTNGNLNRAVKRCILEHNLPPIGNISSINEAGAPCENLFEMCAKPGDRYRLNTLFAHYLALVSFYRIANAYSEDLIDFFISERIATTSRERGLGGPDTLYMKLARLKPKDVIQRDACIRSTLYNVALESKYVLDEHKQIATLVIIGVNNLISASLESVIRRKNSTLINYLGEFLASTDFLKTTLNRPLFECHSAYHKIVACIGRLIFRDLGFKKYQSREEAAAAHAAEKQMMQTDVVHV